MTIHDSASKAGERRPESPESEAHPHTPTTPTARGLRAMAAVRWVLLAIATAAAGYTVWTFWGPAPSHDAAHEQDHFYCPMHPQIRSPHPGTCPICHMKLEPIPADRQAVGTGEPHAHGGAASPPDVVPVTLSSEKQRLIGLATSVVSNESLGERLRVPGVISAPETGRAEVRVRAPGFVERVAVRQTGVRVARGQPLAWIYSPEIYRAQAEFLAAARWNGGADAGTPGGDDIASAARRGLELLGLAASDIDEIARTGKPMRAIPVRAPSAGHVTRYAAALGTRADPDAVLYEIADLSSVWLIASVPERDMASLRVGGTARFSLAGHPSEVITTRIDLVEPALDETTRTARVRAVLPNRDGRLRPGQYGDVELELPSAEGLFVPRDAVIRTGEHEYVYVATGAELLEPRTVRAGPARGGRVQILEGLAAGDRVVTRGSFMLDSESRLQASLAAASPSSSSAPSPAR